MPPDAPERETYRHGDLRQALLDAAVDMARTGGPEAIVLREATRRAGVAPNAAYRHFADRRALVEAVSDAAQGALAATIEGAWDAVPADLAPAERAHAHLRAVGDGYLEFAFAQPGLFRAAFTVPADLSGADASRKAGPSGRTPFQLLGVSLDELVAAGELPADRRPGAEVLAWSAVHGLACLALDGPLRAFDVATRDAFCRRVIAMVDRGV